MLKREGAKSLLHSVFDPFKDSHIKIGAFILARTSKDLFKMLDGIRSFFSNEYPLCQKGPFLRLFIGLAEELSNPASAWRRKPIKLLEALEELVKLHKGKKQELKKELIEEVIMNDLGNLRRLSQMNPAINPRIKQKGDLMLQ